MRKTMKKIMKNTQITKQLIRRVLNESFFDEVTDDEITKAEDNYREDNVKTPAGLKSYAFYLRISFDFDEDWIQNKFKDSEDLISYISHKIEYIFDMWDAVSNYSRAYITKKKFDEENFLNIFGPISVITEQYGSYLTFFVGFNSEFINPDDSYRFIKSFWKIKKMCSHNSDKDVVWVDKITVGYYGCKGVDETTFRHGDDRTQNKKFDIASRIALKLVKNPEEWYDGYKEEVTGFDYDAYSYTKYKAMMKGYRFTEVDLPNKDVRAKDIDLKSILPSVSSFILCQPEMNMSYLSAWDKEKNQAIIENAFNKYHDAKIELHLYMGARGNEGISYFVIYFTQTIVDDERKPFAIRFESGKMYLDILRLKILMKVLSLCDQDWKYVLQALKNWNANTNKPIYSIDMVSEKDCQEYIDSGKVSRLSSRY